MSTRSTTHFSFGKRTEAIIYRHSDGYPEGAGVALLEFLRECNSLPDPRLSEPAYLAAKYVVWLASQFARTENKLDFLSVGVMREDPGDIEYRYLVDCRNADSKTGLPSVRCINVYSREDVPIPITEE